MTLKLCLLSCILLSAQAPTTAQTFLTETAKEELLQAHNDFRGMVNPPATNMRRMSWNTELAQIAQNYANKCIFQHNGNRNSQSMTYQYVGENLYITSSSEVSYREHVKAWYDEVQYYDYGSNSCSNPPCGHYTQVVWADSDMVGCGVKRCAFVTGFSQPNSLLLVCNYGPAGNFVGQKPYVSGTSCSSCPEDLPFCVDKLCSAEDAEPGVLPAPQPTVTQPSPTPLPVSENQEGSVGGEVQGENVPETTITVSVGSMSTGRVNWQLMVPSGVDPKLYFPIKIGMTLPYACLAAFRLQLSGSDSAFSATTTLTYPNGFQLVVQFVSTGFGPGTGTSFSIQASGYFGERVNLNRVTSVALRLRKFPRLGVITGQTTLRGKVSLNFMMSGPAVDRPLPYSSTNLRVAFSPMGGMTKRQSDETALQFSTESNFTARPKPKSKPRPKPRNPNTDEDSALRRREKWERLKQILSENSN